MAKETMPLVSVIIPMYNAEKFISQTLESLLYQTMRDFEVVLVDDCSTDNSVEVVENFKEKFGGRLHVIKLPKNTGTPGLPRNVGIQYAHGKYVAFLDSDDLFTKTALEELSTLAEEFQAEVVHTDGTFYIWVKSKSEDAPEMTDMNLLLNKSNYKIFRPSNSPALKKPAFETENLTDRLNLWLKFGYRWAVSASFCKRDFLIANQIFFPKMKGAEDHVFKFNCLCSAKKFLRAPNITYIIRKRQGSVSRVEADFDWATHFYQWLNVLNTGFRELENIMAQWFFFAEHPNYRYLVTRFFFLKFWDWEFKNHIPSKIPDLDINEISRRVFHPDDAPLASYILNLVIYYKSQIKKLKDENNKLKNVDQK